jgi:hypothetical protein
VVEGMTIFRIPEIYQRCQIRDYLDVDFAVLADRKHRRDHDERDKTAHIIEEQLAWMRNEYETDRAFRSDPNVTVGKREATGQGSQATLPSGSPMLTTSAGAGP